MHHPAHPKQFVANLNRWLAQAAPHMPIASCVLWHELQNATINMQKYRNNVREAEARAAELEEAMAALQQIEGAGSAIGWVLAAGAALGALVMVGAAAVKVQEGADQRASWKRERASAQRGGANGSQALVRDRRGRSARSRQFQRNKGSRYSNDDDGDAPAYHHRSGPGGVSNVAETLVGVMSVGAAVHQATARMFVPAAKSLGTWWGTARVETAKAAEAKAKLSVQLNEDDVAKEELCNEIKSLLL
jgi:hypothetical protein